MTDPKSTAKVIRKMEVRACKCVTVEPACLVDSSTGCELREATGDCDCPMVPGKACRHIRARDHKFSIQDWAELLAKAEPEKYAEPPLAKVASLRMSREKRMEVKIERAKNTKDHPRESLWHPDDQDAAKFDRARIIVKDAGNGRAIEVGLEFTGGR